jgi:Cu2+-exporting ATPase
VPPGVDLRAEIEGELEPMCCHGCQAVATLIASAGLGRYYEFRDALPQRPELDRVSEADFAAWDRPAVRSHYARPDDGGYRISLVLENVHCAACAWLIQRFVGRVPGVDDIRIDVTDGRADLIFDPEQVSLSRVAARLAALGYRPHLDSPTAGSARNKAERRQMLKYIAVAGLGMMQVMSYALAVYIGVWQDIDPRSERFFNLMSMIVAVPVAIYSGQIFYRSAWRSLRRGRMGMDVPVAAAMLLALGSSVVLTWLDAGEPYFDSVVMFIFFLLLGRYAVMVARQNAGQLHSALARSLPDQARRLTDGRPETISRVELAEGDHLLIASGDTVPADGLILSGSALVDEALLSGESIPRRRAASDRVLAGSLVSDGQITLLVEKLGQSTALSGMVRLLAQARTFRPRLARLADRVAGYFIAFVLSGAAIAGLVWWQIDPSMALPVVLAVLVVSCPCALALGTPVALAAAARGFARLGILIARPDALELLPGVSHVVLDKTGTLTRPESGIAEVRLPGDGSVEQARCLAARLERVSRHPLASAFAPFDDGHPVESSEAVVAAGVSGRIDGVDYRLGKPAFVAEWLGRRPVEPGPGQWLALADRREMRAWFRIDSPLRDGAAELVADLQRSGLEVWLASGDRAANVEAAAEALGITRIRSECSPTDKLDLVRRLQADGACVVMIGDGINDAPVLAGSDVSMALAEGADIARTQADLVVTGKGLARISAAFALAPGVRRVVGQNLAWALSYNIIALPIAAAGLVPPWAAAIGMSASSLLVVLNARRLGRAAPSIASDQTSRRGPVSGVPSASRG